MEYNKYIFFHKNWRGFDERGLDRLGCQFGHKPYQKQDPDDIMGWIMEYKFCKKVIKVAKAMNVMENKCIDRYH